MTESTKRTEHTGHSSRAARNRASSKWSATVQSPVVEAGEIVRFGARVVGSAVRHPRGYWGEVRDQMYEIVKLCWIPLVISTVAFGYGAPGLQGLNLFSLFGIPERLGSFFVMASVREFAPWINAMVVAGVVGTAITADLGARRIREEIDATQVLGIDPIRTLIVPRVVALTLMTGLLVLPALAFGVVGGYIAAVHVGGANPSVFVDNFFVNATTTDMWGTVVKCGLFGLIVGVVCSYKGYRASGGPIGVGRAVNQGVVIAFVAIWIFNAVYTTILLGLNPDMQVFR
ncbi:ABC transporter permease [Haloechinothrix sp. YIM 98757]|uniref:ABC transporter permease n=1 Tax=Haloechinothrix aidingensis TaxID=2752311 RepID=A0A838AB86_9PSEU|nr:ABC transporter permease [Haloechinothrix aidingensis]MBA0126504.1 ABC transporter permease [Haloechinothrix aidingensis]